MRIKKGFLEITETKMERDGPSATRAYPIPAATVIAISFALSVNEEKQRTLPLPQPQFYLSLPCFNSSIVVVKRNIDTDLRVRILGPGRTVLFTLLGRPNSTSSRGLGHVKNDESPKPAYLKC